MTSCQSLKAKWQKMENLGEVPSPRHGYRAVAKDDMLIIYGGGNGKVVYQDLFVLKTSTGQWKQVPLFTLPERAGFGLTIIDDNLYLFGGMNYSKRFLNDLYYLSLLTWKWDLLLPQLAPGTPPPCARVGHSFTKVNDQLILLFAGVTEPVGHWMYLNDLYALILNTDGSCIWRLISANGNQPQARESHSACLYKPETGTEKLIIYGGMCGYRLDDVWSLDISTYTWCQYQMPLGRSCPPARSMHGATIAGKRMFIFGGWATVDKLKPNDLFISPPNLCCFNLVDHKWEELDEETASDSFPNPRTGHNMVIVQDKIFMWSGRTGYNYQDEVRVQDDLWWLQVTPQKVTSRLVLANKSETMIKVEWEPVPLATHYLLQIQVMPMVAVNNTDSLTALGKSPTNQNSSPIPTKNHIESFATSYTSRNQTSTPVSKPKIFNQVPIPTPINTNVPISTPIETKASIQCPIPIPMNPKVVSNQIPIQASVNPHVSNHSINHNAGIPTQINPKTPNLVSNPPHINPKTLSQVPIPNSTNPEVPNHAPTPIKPNIPKEVTIPTCVKTEVSNSTYINTKFSKLVCIPTCITPKVSNQDSIPSSINPKVSSRVSIPSCIDSKLPNQVSISTCINTKVSNQSSIATSINPKVSNRISIPACINPKVVSNRVAIPATINPKSAADSLNNSRNQKANPRVSIQVPTSISISSPVITATPKSTLETFLKPNTSRLSSVKLMRSSSGRPVAVVPRSLIPSSTTSATKPSNIVIVARKRPYL